MRGPSDGVPSAEADTEFEDPPTQPDQQLPPANEADLAAPADDAHAVDYTDAMGRDDLSAPADEPAVPGAAELVAAIRDVEQQARSFHARAENYEQIIRQMQGRIEQLQGDQVQALLKPVIQRFAGLHAQATEASEKARERSEASDKDFGFFVVAIEEALGLVDIESVGAAEGGEFDSNKHHASRVVTTEDSSLDRHIQRVLRQGFTYVGAPRVFLPAQVSLYRYELPPDRSDRGTHREQSPPQVLGEGDTDE